MQSNSDGFKDASAEGELPNWLEVSKLEFEVGDCEVDELWSRTVLLARKRVAFGAEELVVYLHLREALPGVLYNHNIRV